MLWAGSKRSAWTAGHRVTILQRKEDVMLTLCIRYTLDAAKVADFEAYARGVAGPIERCGGKVVGYFAPTKFAGPTNIGLSLIDFPSLAAYERYREALAADPEHTDVARRAAQSGVILVEDRSFMQRVS
jgi:hypothetical protein